MHLEIGLCEHYSAQLKLLLPGTSGKCSLESEHPLLTKFVLIMKSCFCPIQCTACKIRQGSSKNKFILTRVTRILSTLHQSHCLSGTNCLSNSARYIEIVCISFVVYTYFFLPLYIVQFRQEILFFGVRLFNMWELLHFNYSYCKFFRTKSRSCKYNMIKSNYWF